MRGQNVEEAWNAYLEELVDVSAAAYAEAEERAWDRLQDALCRIAEERMQDDIPFL